MEHSKFEKDKVHWSGPLLIVRDTLIFLTCILVIVLIYVVSPQTFTSAATSKRTASADVSFQPQNTTSSSETHTEAPQISTAMTSNVSTTTESPTQTPDPVPSPTPDTPATHGDFSATFPTNDTGENALYSYQGDTTKIAINKVQTDGVTYFVADVRVKNIDAFHTA